MSKKNISEEENLDSGRSLLRISKFLKPFAGLFVLVIFLNSVFSLFSAASITIIKPIFELIFNVEGTGNIPGAAAPKNLLTNFLEIIKSIVQVKGDPVTTLINLALLTIVIFVLKNVFKYLSSISSVKLKEGLIKSIRDRIFTRLTSLSVDFFSKRKSGSIISIITNDVNALNESTIASFNVILRDLIQVIILMLVLLGISVKLTLIAFSTSVISLLIMRLSMKYIRRYASRMQSAMADYTSTLQEMIFGIRVVKAYNAEQNSNERFLNDTGKYVKSSVKHQKIIALIPSINEIFAILALSVVLFVGGSSVLNGEMQPDYLMLFLFTLFSIMSPIAQIINHFAKFQRGFVAADRVFKVLDQRPTVESGKDEISSFDSGIEVKDLSFAYEEEKVLINTDLSIPKTKKIAFVGPSGSGKSTMLDLLIRFYDPSEGMIEIDGKDIRELKIESYRGLFGIVSQESLLFNDTVANNIKFGSEDATMDDVYRAAKIANAYDFIQHLPKGFETIIGDRGIVLSGGQQQRISIARALVRNPQILVFDEATSALDSESEKVVQLAINDSLKDRTAVIVAHRLATIIDCDEIYVFDEGRIVEHGRHDELIKNNGVYKKLYDIQFAQEKIREGHEDQN